MKQSVPASGSLLLAREPENLVLELLRGIRADVARGQQVDATKEQLRGEMHSLRADAAADFSTIRKETIEQIAGLRRAVVEYHSAVLGHGVLISDLEARAPIGAACRSGGNGGGITPAAGRSP